jgi:hypothetical protein
MKSRLPTILLGLWLIGTVFASGYAYYSYRALDYDAIDGSFFLGFYDKFLTPGAAHTINPEGKNIFFFSGTDGERSLHQDIHFEPVKYLLGFLYQAFGPVSVMIAIAAVVFSPLLYGAFLARSGALTKAGAVLLAVYAAFPAVFYAASSGMRPSALLAPLVLLCFLSLSYGRPLREQLAFFVALFLVREEAILFGIPIIAAVFARAGALRAHAAVWLAGSVSFALYILWTGYSFGLTPEKVARYLPLPALGLAGALLLAAGALLAWRFHSRILDSVDMLAPIAVSGVSLAVIVAHLVVDRRLLETPILDLLRANYGAVAVAGVVAAVMAVTRRTPPRYLVQASASLALGALFVLVAMIAKDIQNLAEKYEAGALVWSAKVEYPDSVLADYATIFAWYDAANTVALERVPAEVLSGASRFYPENREAVLEHLEHAEAAVVSRRNEALLYSLAEEAGRALDERGGNQRYVWYELD